MESVIFCFQRSTAIGSNVYLILYICELYSVRLENACDVMLASARNRSARMDQLFRKRVGGVLWVGYRQRARSSSIVVNVNSIGF